MAESLLDGSPQVNAPTEAAEVLISVFPPQPLFDTGSVFPAEGLSSGSESVPDTPSGASAGPEARMRTVREVEPPTTKPAIRMLPPVPTWTRAEMLTIRGLVGVYAPAGVAS